jgi:hypothetical protein
MTGMKTAGVIAALFGLVMLIKERRSNTGLQKAIESNWKEIKKKLPADWVEIAPKKRKEAARFINSVHKATGQSRRRIRQTLQGLTA